jgi:GPI mannosyltransferase 3
MRAGESGLWLGFALSVIASHSLVPHKEYRFIFPALACLVIVAAMGSADFLEMLRKRLRPDLEKYIAASGVVFWIVTSTSLAFSAEFSPNWFRSKDMIETSFWLSAQPSLCGLLLYDDSWSRSGGYAYLHRNIPIYSLRLRHDQAKAATEAFNFIILHRASVADFSPQFGMTRCVGEGEPEDLCVVKRAGSCRRVPDLAPLLEQSRLGERPQ